MLNSCMAAASRAAQLAFPQAISPRERQAGQGPHATCQVVQLAADGSPNYRLRFRFRFHRRPGPGHHQARCTS